MALSIDLEGRVVLVCGVARGGIGGATARKLAEAGATVFAVDKAQDILDPTLADLEAAGARCHGMVANLLFPEQSDPIVEAVWNRFGRLDGVANVCGGTRENEWMPLAETPIDAFRETLNLNLDYVFRICRDAAASMMKRDHPGSMVNIGSISALAAAPVHGPYGAAKAGIAALTRTMAFEWAHYGIRANTVNPGAVPTERVIGRRGEAGYQAFINDFDGAWTTADELAQTVVFLLSDLASGISGQTISVDSGLTTKYAASPTPLQAVKRKLAP